VEVQRKLSGAVVGLQGRLRCSALGQEGVRPRENVGLCRVGSAQSLPVATMHRFKDLRGEDTKVLKLSGSRKRIGSWDAELTADP
jgi:hypothetical protein